jgi:hypothetical protein
VEGGVNASVGCTVVVVVPTCWTNPIGLQSDCNWIGLHMDCCSLMDCNYLIGLHMDCCGLMDCNYHWRPWAKFAPRLGFILIVPREQ